jgi:ABC-2 type transport system ATP-binding protein
MISSAELAIEAAEISFSYGERAALTDVHFDVQPGEIFAILGPNGGGKSTLFRLLSTLIPLQLGTLRIFGHVVPDEQQQVRCSMGVVFQSPSLDRKLTVMENMRGQAALFGIVGAEASHRCHELLEQFGLLDRGADLAEQLSGGQRRRVEIAKGMIHSPKLLLMDEPSTGLDPGVRRDLAQTLEQLRTDNGVTIVMTTHLLEEAERADRLAILDQGRLVALDTPAALQKSVGGDVITIIGHDVQQLREDIEREFQLSVTIVDGALRMEASEGGQLVGRMMQRFGDRVSSITVGHPTLEDVFVAKTGRRLD